MSKWKQIEDLRDFLERVNGKDGISILGTVPLAEALYEAGYRKIDNGNRSCAKVDDCNNCNRKGKNDPACQVCVAAYDYLTNSYSTPSYWQPKVVEREADDERN